MNNMTKIASSLTELIGNTPLLELSNFNKKKQICATIIAKLEYFNPAGSVKDRIAKAMIEDAEEKGLLKEGSVIINKVLENGNVNFWYDANNDTFVDMLEIWIIDPKKVERIALQEAISLAWMFLTTEAAVCDIPKKDDGGCNGACHAGGAGMWGMGWMWMY